MTSVGGGVEFKSHQFQIMPSADATGGEGCRGPKKCATTLKRALDSSPIEEQSAGKYRP